MKARVTGEEKKLARPKDLQVIFGCFCKVLKMFENTPMVIGVFVTEKERDPLPRAKCLQ